MSSSLYHLIILLDKIVDRRSHYQSSIDITFMQCDQDVFIWKDQNIFWKVMIGIECLFQWMQHSSYSTVASTRMIFTYIKLLTHVRW